MKLEQLHEASYQTGRKVYIVTAVDYNSEELGITAAAGPFSTGKAANSFARMCEKRYYEGDNPPNRGRGGPMEYQFDVIAVMDPKELVADFDHYFDLD